MLRPKTGLRRKIDKLPLKDSKLKASNFLYLRVAVTTYSSVHLKAFHRQGSLVGSESRRMTSPVNSPAVIKNCKIRWLMPLQGS